MGDLGDAVKYYESHPKEWMRSLKNEISSNNKPCNHCGCRVKNEIKEVFHDNLDEIRDELLNTYGYNENEIALISQVFEFIKTKV